MSTRLMRRAVVATLLAPFSLLPVGCGTNGATAPTQRVTTPATQPSLPVRPTSPPTTQPKAEAAPRANVLSVTAERMAQEFIDDPGKAYPHYSRNPFQITGVITARRDQVAEIQVSGTKGGKPVAWTFVMVFPKAMNADGVEVGKKVTLRGTPAATGVGTTTIDVGEVVRD